MADVASIKMLTCRFFCQSAFVFASLILHLSGISIKAPRGQTVYEISRHPDAKIAIAKKHVLV